MSTLHVFNKLNFAASCGTVMLRIGDVVKINLSAKDVKKQSGGSKKKVVMGKILGFVKFCYLPQGGMEAFGQGYVWYRQVPRSVYGDSKDSEHVVNTTCLGLTAGAPDLMVQQRELEEVQRQAPCSLKVEVYHRPHVARSSTLTPPSEQSVEEEEEGEGEEEEGGGDVKTKEHFRKENIEDVSKGKKFKLFAAEPVDITVTVLSGHKKLVLHRPNDPSKKYSVRLYTKDKDFKKSNPKRLYTKVEDKVTKTVSFDRFRINEAAKAPEKNVVHYFNRIQFNRSDEDVITLCIDVMDGKQVLFTKEFQVKVRSSDSGNFGQCIKYFVCYCRLPQEPLLSFALEKVNFTMKTSLSLKCLGPTFLASNSVSTTTEAMRRVPLNPQSPSLKRRR
jgi:hypothetical protein